MTIPNLPCVARRAALLVVACSACGDGDRAPAPPAASFILGFWADRGDGESFTVGEEADLPSGAQLGMALEIDGSCEVYVIYRDSHGAVAVLHPPVAGDARAPGYYEPVPDGTRLDKHTGFEVFHVIASREPLVPLSRAVANLRAAAPDAAEDAKMALLEVLQQTRARFEDVAIAAPSPALLAGRIVRANPHAFRLEVSSVVCRSFTIDHR